MLNVPLIKCKINLILTWSANCVITSMTKCDITTAQRDNPVVFDNSQTVAMLAITDAKPYVPVVTVLTQDDNELLQQLKKGFKRTIKWNKYRSETSN